MDSTLGSSATTGASFEASSALINGNHADNAITQAGAVYVFNYDGNVWQQQAYLKTGEIGFFLNVGSAMSFSADGNVLAVGSFYSGKVYIFRRNANNNQWSLDSAVNSAISGRNDHFGDSLELSSDGNTLAVGARTKDSDGGLADVGVVHVFEYENNLWVESAILTASAHEGDDSFSAAAEDQFGNSISLSGDGATLVVGAHEKGFEAIDRVGAVYIFRKDEADNWIQLAAFRPEEPTRHNYFGSSVKISPDAKTIAIGAIASHLALPPSKVHILKNDNGVAWTRSAVVFQATDFLSSSDKFGSSVSLSADGSILAVGAPLEDSSFLGFQAQPVDNDESKDAGAVYVYKQTENNLWQLISYVKPRHYTGSPAGFGSSLSLSADGKNMVVGAPFESSSTTGIDSIVNQINDLAKKSGASFLY